ncbi:MAG: extracellular solute-binding protein [Chloroflexi bacterium]|nr:extracellular solute-binding protein [Chloroflexota bacterium]
MKSFSFVFAIVALFLLSLTASAQDGVTLTVLVEQGGLWLQEAAAKQFEEETGHTVEFVNVPYGSVFDRLSAEMATGGAAFDVATIDVVWMSHFAPFAEPLDELFTDEVIDDLFASLVADAQIDGTFVGMPTWANTEIIFYRKDLWEDPDEQAAFEAEFGYALAPPATWQEFTDMAMFFTRDNDGDGDIDMYGTDVKGGVADFEWMIAVLQAGSPGVVLDADHNIIIDNAEHVAGLEYYISHHCDMDVAPPNVNEVDWGVAENLFYQSQTAMFRFWGHAYRLTRGDSPIADLVGAAPMIAGPGGVGAIPGPWFNIVPKTSENKELALELVQYLYDNNAMGIEAPLGLAARKSAYASYADVEGFENLKPLLETLDSPQTIGRPAVADWQQIADEILGPIGSDALTCEQDPAELLAWGRAELEAMGYE